MQEDTSLARIGRSPRRTGTIFAAKYLRSALITSALLLVVGKAQAGDAIIAVAANFAAPIKEIAVGFERETGHRIVASFGSTGQLYAQVRNGAPFDIFFSADATTVSKLVADGKAVGGTRFTYALGKLALWSARSGFVTGDASVLSQAHFDKIAIANPRLAPYGIAAVETLRALRLHDALQPKFVIGENISQTFQFVATGNAQLGFVALSQIMKAGRITHGSAWIVDPTLYTPIKQDAVLLEKGRNAPAATVLLKYLRSDTALAIFQSYGYGL